VLIVTNLLWLKFSLNRTCYLLNATHPTLHSPYTPTGALAPPPSSLFYWPSDRASSPPSSIPRLTPKIVLCSPTPLYWRFYHVEKNRAPLAGKVLYLFNCYREIIPHPTPQEAAQPCCRSPSGGWGRGLPVNIKYILDMHRAGKGTCLVAE
jgi:hypothetical protein